MASRYPNAPQSTQQELDEIKKLLESKLSEKQTQLHQLRASEANNPSAFEQLPLRDLEQTKKCFIQTLIEKVTPQPPDFYRSGELLFKTVLEKLEMQLKETTKLIQSERHVLNGLNKRLESLQEQCETFDTIIATRSESGEMKQADNLDTIKKELDAEFQKHMKALKYVITTIYPEDSDMKRILKDLLNSYLENPNAYVEFSEEDLGNMMRLFVAELVTRHPYDKMKVRLC